MTEYYKEKFEAGLEYQDWLCDFLLKHYGIFLGQYSSRKYQQKKGETQAGYEIKHDMQMETTRNVFIEISEKSNDNIKNWTPSGIYREDNCWIYVIGNYKEILIFSKSQLQKVVESENLLKSHGMKYKEIKMGTSKGYTLPIQKAIDTGLCLKYIKVKEGEKDARIS